MVNSDKYKNTNQFYFNSKLQAEKTLSYAQLNYSGVSLVSSSMVSIGTATEYPEFS